MEVSEEGIELLGVVVPGGVWAAWSGCWEPNLGSLQEQHKLLTTEPSLQSPKSTSLIGTTFLFKHYILFFPLFFLLYFLKLHTETSSLIFLQESLTLQYTLFSYFTSVTDSCACPPPPNNQEQTSQFCLLTFVYHRAWGVILCCLVFVYAVSSTYTSWVLPESQILTQLGILTFSPLNS